MQNNFKMVREPIFTFLILGLNILIFILSFLILSLYPDWNYAREGICARILKNFCFIPSKLKERPWTLITSAFLHADFAHIFYNMFALFFFGTYLEARIGNRKFLLVYFFSAIFGSIAYWIFSPNSNIPALGASAAIFGILGSLAVLYPFLIVWIGFAPMPIIFAAVLWGIISFFGMFVPSQIAYHAHLGGLLAGILIGLILRKRRKRVIRFYYGL